MFDALKADNQFVKNIENRFQIYKFSENKDQLWLKGQFNTYRTVIESLPKSSTN